MLRRKGKLALGRVWRQELEAIDGRPLGVEGHVRGANGECVGGRGIGRDEQVGRGWCYGMPSGWGGGGGEDAGRWVC